MKWSRITREQLSGMDKDTISRKITNIDLNYIFKNVNDSLRVQTNYQISNFSQDGTITMENVSEDGDFLSLRKLFNPRHQRTLMELTHYFSNGVARKVIARKYFIQLNEKEEEIIKKSHKSPEVQLSDYDFTDPAWGGYVK